MDVDRVIAGEETEQAYRPTFTNELDVTKVSTAEVGHGEGEAERVTEEAEVEEWIDPGGTSDTQTSWLSTMWSWIRRTTR